MRDLFQVVYDLKKKDGDKTKQYSFDTSGKTVKISFYIQTVRMKKSRFSSVSRACFHNALVPTLFEVESAFRQTFFFML